MTVAHLAHDKDRCCVICVSRLETGQLDVLTAQQTVFVHPVCRSAADTGPFILRAWAPCAVQLEQLPSPHSLRQGGRWLGSSAGGGRAHATWASNPQYLVTCARETTALLCLQRPDVCNSLMPQPFEPQGCVNLTVCQLNTPAGAKVGTPAVMAANALAAAAAAAAGSKVVGSTHDCRMDRTVLLCKLLPGTPYVVVPSTAEPGRQAGLWPQACAPWVWTLMLQGGRPDVQHVPVCLQCVVCRHCVAGLLYKPLQYVHCFSPHQQLFTGAVCPPALLHRCGGAV